MFLPPGVVVSAGSPTALAFGVGANLHGGGCGVGFDFGNVCAGGGSGGISLGGSLQICCAGSLWDDELGFEPTLRVVSDLPSAKSCATFGTSN